MGGIGAQISSAEAASALEWWLEAGVDTLVEERPRNWLEQAPLPPEPAVEAAPAIPGTLALFREWIGSPEAPLAARGSRPVLPRGEEAAEVMVLMESPGREDASAGTPIAGEAAELLERMMKAIGLTMSQTYLANLSCFHSPGIKPKADDLERCAAAARRHVSLARPKRLLLLGNSPSLALLGKPISEARGHVHKVEGIRTVVTFHPRFLLQQPGQKRQAWNDLLLLMEDVQ